MYATNGNSPDHYLLALLNNWGGTDNNGTLRGVSEGFGNSVPNSRLQWVSQSFGYDGVNRLVWASNSGGWSRSFGYDAFGNGWITANSGTALSGNTPTSNVFTGANQMTGASYDAAGNQTVVNGDTLAYDAESRMTQATESAAFGGGQANYLYDGDGRRVEKSLPGGTTVYVYDGLGQLAAEYNSAITPSAPCRTCYLSWDHLGSIRFVTDQNGNWVAWHDYLPFGEELPANTAGRNGSWGAGGDNVNQKFTGQMRDQETGMDYFSARYYGAALGRFTSPDPANAGADPEHPQSWNGYAYVGNDPLNFVDPSGLSLASFFDAISGGIGRVFGGGGGVGSDTYCVTFLPADCGGGFGTRGGGPGGILFAPPPFVFGGGVGGGGGNRGGGTPGGGGGGGKSQKQPPSQQPTKPQLPPKTGNPTDPNKQRNCMIEAAKEKGLSMGLDLIGTIPAVGNAVATTGRIARGAIALDQAITKPIVPIASGAYSAYGAITEKPGNQLDNFVGLVSASGGLGLTFADMSLGGTKAIPVVGNFLSAVALGWDGYQAFTKYQKCMGGAAVVMRRNEHV